MSRNSAQCKARFPAASTPRFSRGGSNQVLEGSARAFELPVKDVMVTRLETISGDAPIRELIPLFRRDLVAIVMDGSHFLGIATRLDLVNYFRIAQTS